MQKNADHAQLLSQLRKQTYHLLYDYNQAGRFEDVYHALNLLNAFERQRRCPLTLRLRNHKAVYSVLYSLSCANPIRIAQSGNAQWFDRDKIASQQRERRFDPFYLKKA